MDLAAAEMKRSLPYNLSLVNSGPSSSAPLPIKADDSSSPKGVIDLELYSNIEIGDGGDESAIELRSDPDARLRHFYFRADNAEEGIGWAQSLRCNRYQVLQEERDAYMLLQGDLSSQLGKVLKEKEVLSDGISSCEKQLESTLGHLRTFLVRYISCSARDTESMDLEECLRQIGRACESAKDSEACANRNVSASRFQAAINAETVTRQSEELSRARDEFNQIRNELEEMTRCMERERIGRMESEAAAIEAKFAASEAQKELEKLHIELGVITEERRKLSDQKNVLLKEIKLSRNAFEEQQQLSGSSSLRATIGGGEVVDNTTNANNLGESEEEMSSSTGSSNNRTTVERNMIIGKQRMCMEDITQYSDSAASAPPPAGFQRLMGHYTRTTSILTDIRNEDDDSSNSCTDVDIERNIVCRRCNCLVAGPFFSICQCPVPLLESSSTNPAAASVVARGGFTTLLRKVTSTFVDGKHHCGKESF